MSTIELFDEITATTQPETVETTEVQETEPAKDESPKVEVTVPEVPDGAISVSAFAELLTKMEIQTPDGEVVRFPYGFVLPQNVYQAAKKADNAIPHVLVKDSTDKRPRLYIMRDSGLEYWAEMEKANAGKPGSSAGSKRTPEDLKAGYLTRLQKKHYAQSRLDMWTEMSTKEDKTAAKYRGWLNSAGLSADDIAAVEAEARLQFATDQQKKQDERDAKAADRKTAREAAKAAPAVA